MYQKRMASMDEMLFEIRIIVRPSPENAPRPACCIP